MRIERLVIEAGDDTFTLDLHNRVTVVAGMERVERSSLIGELIGALGGSRPGVHLELEERSGRHLAVFRPTVGRHRVVDVDNVVDITASRADENGTCDLLAHMGLDADDARRIMRFTRADLETTTERSQAIEELAGVDQKRLWAAAEGLVRANEDLATEATARGTAIEDVDLIDEVERRHYDLERAADNLDTTRRRTFIISGASGVATIPGVLLAGAIGLSFIAIAVVAVLASLWARHQMNRAARAEERALADAGVTTYLGFQLQRVNSLLGDDTGRGTLMDAAGVRRDALAAWHQVAGSIPVDWALEHREEIQSAARLRREVDALGVLSANPFEVSAEQTDELAHAVVARLAEARTVAGEGLPLLLDEPFSDLDPSMKTMLLELISHTAGDPQIVILTNDEDIASWARLESLTGDVALIEPADAQPAADVEIDLVSEGR